jgi:hypothetical protein
MVCTGKGLPSLEMMKTKCSLRPGEDIHRKSDDQMKGIPNRQKTVVVPKDRKPKEAVNFRKVNQPLAKKWRAKVRKAQQ